MIRRAVHLLISVYLMIAEQVLRVAAGYVLRRALRG